MKSPLVLRGVHDAKLAEMQARLDAAVFRAAQAESQADYWRKRAELFIDRAAAKAGVSHEPVMREPPKDVHTLDLNPFGGIGISVIDSTREDGRPAAN